MNHEKYQEWIELALYQELDEVQLKELNDHLTSCPKCNALYKAEEKFHNFLSEHKPLLSSKLLAEARFELQGALRAERNRITFLGRLKDNLSRFLQGKKLIFATGIATLIMGMFIGYLLFKTPMVEQGNDSGDLVADSFKGSDVKISNIRFLDQGGPEGEIEFQYEAVKPVRMRGNISDPEIQSVLMHAVLNEENPGVRLNSLNALGQKGESFIDNDIKDALIMVVKYDANPGVRREALLLLKKHKYDTDVKETFLYVLMNDSVSGLRIEAINGLKRAKEEGVTFNEDARDVLRERMAKDENNYVRYQAKNVLEELIEQ